MLIPVLVALLLTACHRGPPAEQTRADVEQRLEQLFGTQLLTVAQFRRQGSAPLRSEEGRRRVLVYYNAVLQFTEPYDPADWTALSPQVLAESLGATPDGVAGFRAGGNTPGSELRTYGSIPYVRDGDVWQAESGPAVAVRPERDQARLAAAEGAVPRSRADELVQRLARLVEASPGLRDASEDVIAEELDQAYRNISLRLERNRERIVLASGPQGGEYWRVVQAFTDAVPEKVRPVVAATEGSVRNAFLVDAGQAQLGLIQSDVAAAALLGEGPFAAGGSLLRLRALASLFPEPVHVVVRADSDIVTVGDLRGRRVGLGEFESGARYTALKVLAAHGVAGEVLAEAFHGTPAEALARLAEGRLDAVLTAVSVPWRQLKDADGVVPLRLVSLDPAAIAQIAATTEGLVPMEIAPRSYARQQVPVRTVAATALLVASSELAALAVEDLLASLFAEDRPRSARTARITRNRALVGVTVPLHEGAARYYGTIRSESGDGAAARPDPPP